MKTKRVDRIEYENRIVCFIDILGFRKTIEGTIEEDAEGHIVDNTDEVERVHNALMEFRGNFWLDGHPLGDEHESINETKTFTHFSDSIVISFKADEPSEVFYTLYDFLLLCASLIDHEIIFRGAITYGKLIHTEKLLFGPALVEAYDLERNEAKYPRIILSADVIDIGAKTSSMDHCYEDERDYIEGLIKKDTDGFFYVDYFEKAYSEFDDPNYDYPIYLSRLHELITNGLKTDDTKVKAKYEWMAEKYNETVKGFHEGARVNAEETDPDIIDAFLSIPLIK